MTHLPGLIGIGSGDLQALLRGRSATVSSHTPSEHERCSRPLEIVCASPIAQQVGHPRKANTPTAASSKLTGPTTGMSATEQISAPKPTTPRTRCRGSDELAKLWSSVIEIPKSRAGQRALHRRAGAVQP